MRKKAVFIVCYLAYTFIYIGRLNLTMASPALKSQNIFTSAQIGLLGSVFFVVYALGRLVNGVLSEHFHARNMIAAGLLLGAAANIIFGFLPPFAAVLLVWAVNAYAQSMLWSAVLKTMGAVYGEEKAQKMSAYMITSVAAGNIAGILLGTLIISKIGVNAAFIIPGGMLAAAALVVALVVGKSDKTQKIDANIKKALKQREIFGMAVPALFHGVMKDNISLWMAVYVADKFGLEIEKFAFYLLLIPAAGLIGRFLYPSVFSLLGNNGNNVSAFGFAVCAVFSALLIFLAETPFWAVFYLSMIYIAVSLINTSILSVFPMRFYSEGISGTVSGIMDFNTYLGAGIGSAVYGLVIEDWGYNAMFISWLIISLISIPLIFRKRRESSGTAAKAEN